MNLSRRTPRRRFQLSHSSERRKKALKRRAAAHFGDKPNPSTLYGFSSNYSDILNHLWLIAEELSAYPLVNAIFYRTSKERVEVVVVAERPMTKMISLLLEGRREELGIKFPCQRWDLRVIQDNPSPGHGFSSYPLSSQ
ncbi:MAG: hypothetical protein C0609_11055 [Deltaproteobacteria bacterium]|nr:MAG: hypothetical protein C0609_11055 [Deltaproteobacteria bacterium]